VTPQVAHPHPAERPSRAWSRAAGGALLGYAVLMVAGVALLGTPEGDADDAVWVAHFADQDSRRQVLVAGLLVVVGGLAFLVGTAGLVARAASGPWATLLGSVGTAHGILVVVAGMVGSSMAITSELVGMPVPRDPDLLRLSDSLFFATLLIPGSLSAGLVAWCCASEPWLPRPLALAGRVVAVLSVAGLALFPVVLWLLWIVAAAVVLMRNPSAADVGHAS